MVKKTRYMHMCETNVLVGLLRMICDKGKLDQIIEHFFTRVWNMLCLMVERGGGGVK